MKHDITNIKRISYEGSKNLNSLVIKRPRNELRFLRICIVQIHITWSSSFLEIWDGKKGRKCTTRISFLCEQKRKAWLRAAEVRTDPGPTARNGNGSRRKEERRKRKTLYVSSSSSSSQILPLYEVRPALS